MKDENTTNELGLLHPSSFILHPSSLPVLPLATFERFLWLEDRPEYPMTFVLQLTFSGRLDRAAFTRALTIARQRQPLLCALVQENRGALCWTPAPHLSAPIYWEEKALDAPFPFLPDISLRSEVGLRVLVRENPPTSRDRQGAEETADSPLPAPHSPLPAPHCRTDLFWQFHHVCCDGLGALEFVEDVLVEYAVALGQPALKKRLLQPELLHGRGRFHLPPLSWREQLRDVWVGLRLGVKMLRQAVPLAPPPPIGRQSGTSHEGCPPFLRATLSSQERQTLRDAAARFEATLNDLLLCALFGVVEAWNAGKSGRQGPIRLMMPTNLRLPQDVPMPAANVLAFTFLDRSPAQCRQAAALLSSIGAETAALKRWRLGLYFIGVMAFVLPWPRVLNYLLGGSRCFASLYLTNLGDPLHRFVADFPTEDGRCVVGNVVLENITAFPPLRASTPAAFSATTYGRQLQLGLHFDQGFFSPPQAQELLDLFTEQLRRLPALLTPR